MPPTIQSELLIEKVPGLLVSYVYYDKFAKGEDHFGYRDWILDSGAFSAWKSGYDIQMDDYIAFVRRRLEHSPRMTEVVALDVIGSGVESLKNAIYMKSQGLEVVPVFHLGDEWSILRDYCKEHEKVGLSCRFGEPIKESYKFLDKCFSIAWPHKFHSFGWVDEKMLMQYPFHSSDTASWTNGPNVYGRWKSMGGKMSVYGSTHQVISEVEHYLEIERKLRWKWQNEMKKLGDVGFISPTLRLAYSVCTVADNTLRLLGDRL